MTEFSVTDRRRVGRGLPEEPAARTLPHGVREVIRRIQGVDCAVRVYPDGRMLLDRIIDPEPENLKHRFETCDKTKGGCGEQHAVLGDATFDPGADCPRSPGNGWQWWFGYGPGYGPNGRDDAKRQLDPGGLTTRTNNLNQLAREMERRGFNVD